MPEHDFWNEFDTLDAAGGFYDSLLERLDTIRASLCVTVESTDYDAREEDKVAK